MKTIKIILNEDGSVKSLTYQFQINQYSYNDTLINVYVPTEILDLNVSDDNITYADNVEMGVLTTLANGTQKMGKPYFFTFVKSNIVIDNVSYTLFERKMPKEFTYNYGTQNYAINVIQQKTTHDLDDDTYTTETIGVITSNQLQLLINRSVNMADDPIVEDTDLSTLIANVNALLSNILLKQDKNDNLIQVLLANGGLTTTDSVVIALNSLNDRVNQNFTNIGGNDNDIAQLQQDVIDINTKLITGFRYCGSVTTTTPPNSTLLDNFMSLQGLTKQNGDIVNWVQEIEDETDKRYRCIYGANGWSWQELPKIETASNGDAGLVMGNYNIGDTTSDILANIIGGKITEIYYKNNGVYYNLSTDLTNAITEIANIINGTTTVGKSQYATYDITEYGSATPKSIDQKYLTQSLGATKQFVKDYALPKQFGDVYFLNTVNGKFETDLNPSSTNIQTTLSSIGYQNILDVYLDNNVNASYQLSKKNSISLSIYIALSTTTSINFRLDVTYKKGGTTTPMCNLITSTYSFTANTYKKIDFTSYLTLITNELNVENGQYEIKISANMTTSTPITFTIYSTTSLPTTFNLNLYSTSLIIGSGYLGEINYHELTGVRNGGYCNYDMPSDTDLLDNTEHRFLLTIPLDAVDSDVVRIRKGTTNIPIFSNKTNTMYHYFLKSYISYSGKASFVATYYNGTLYLNDEIETDKISYVVVDSLSGTITNYRYFMNAYDYDYLGIICRDSNSGENVKYVVSDNGSGNLYNLKSIQTFRDANGDFYYTGTINRSSGVYSLGNKVYLQTYYNFSASSYTNLTPLTTALYSFNANADLSNALSNKQNIMLDAIHANTMFGTNQELLCKYSGYNLPLSIKTLLETNFSFTIDKIYNYNVNSYESMDTNISVVDRYVKEADNISIIKDTNNTYYIWVTNATILLPKCYVSQNDGNGNATEIYSDGVTYNIGGYKEYLVNLYEDNNGVEVSFKYYTTDDIANMNVSDFFAYLYNKHNRLKTYGYFIIGFNMSNWKTITIMDFENANKIGYYDNTGSILSWIEATDVSTFTITDTTTAT